MSRDLPPGRALELEMLQLLAYSPTGSSPPSDLRRIKLWDQTLYRGPLFTDELFEERVVGDNRWRGSLIGVDLSRQLIATAIKYMATTSPKVPTADQPATLIILRTI